MIIDYWNKLNTTGYYWQIAFFIFFPFFFLVLVGEGEVPVWIDEVSKELSLAVDEASLQLVKATILLSTQDGKPVMRCWQSSILKGSTSELWSDPYSSSPWIPCKTTLLVEGSRCNLSSSEPTWVLCANKLAARLIAVGVDAKEAWTPLRKLDADGLVPGRVESAIGGLAATFRVSASLTLEGGSLLNKLTLVGQGTVFV